MFAELPPGRQLCIDLIAFLQLHYHDLRTCTGNSAMCQVRITQRGLLFMSLQYLIMRYNMCLSYLILVLVSYLSGTVFTVLSVVLPHAGRRLRISHQLHLWITHAKIKIERLNDGTRRYLYMDKLAGCVVKSDICKV